jgi:sec-independent protein translocase protein TatC
MIFGPMLKLRDKITQKRKSLTQDEEKPFLEHLDDLRKTISKILLTLVVAVIGCFIFNDYFFKILEKPLEFARLHQPKERKLPEYIANLEGASETQKQDLWWRIHGTARGMADLDGPQRDLFLKLAANDDLTRQFANALLFYHAADCLPEKEREGYIASAAKLLPESDQPKVVEFAAQLAKAGTSAALEKPRNFVEMEAFAPAEGFMLSMKLSLFAGIIVSFPLLFFFLLEFILPGLTGKERKMIFPALSIGFGLFLTGVTFAYFVVVPQALEYFHEYSANIGIVDNWRIGLYISFVTSFTLIFGLVFETPVVIMVMVKLGLLTSGTMRRTRGWAVVIMLVAAAVITPTGDMFSMSLMAGPMIIMYEICIWLAWFHERKQRRLEAEEQRQDQLRRASLVGVASVQTPRPGTDTDVASGDSDEGDGGSPLALPAPDDDTPPSGESQSVHPHHPDENAHDSTGDYEQYLRDHSHMHSVGESHTEYIPVEERPDYHTPESRGQDDAADETPSSPSGSAIDPPPSSPEEKKDEPESPGPQAPRPE